MSELNKDTKLSDLMPSSALELLVGSGAGLIRQISLDVIRGIILDILMGKNIRDSTEALTRSRISALNMAMVNLFLKGSTLSSSFINNLPFLAADILTKRGLSKPERWLAQWMLGLTDKGVQNILRDDKEAFKDYSALYAQICKEIIDTHQQEYGKLTGEINLGDTYKTEVDWLFVTYLLNAIGSQTLTIRGSSKSSMGKLFEKLVLGSLLSILGFTFSSSHDIGEKVFWLSTRDEHRESDATLLYVPGKGVRFDIGFIGRGNSEISLDKVTRYQHEAKVGRTLYYMATIIIIDRIGSRSNIERLAEAANGRIVQMSASYWPKLVASYLNEAVGLDHELLDMEQSRVEDYLKEKMKYVPLESFVGILPTEVEQQSLFSANDNEDEYDDVLDESTNEEDLE